MKTDPQLRTDVQAELAWDPAVTDATIGVAVKDGVVTLSGTVNRYMEKTAAAVATRRVAGVRGIAMDLEVKLAPGHVRGDSEIADAAAHALRWNALVPPDKIVVEVDDGWVTLTGEVDWPYQSSSAERCIEPLVGVRGVLNHVKLRQRVNAETVRDQIASALARHARREAQHIAIEIEGGVVTLRGQVESMAEHDAALGTAGTTAGVTRVVDRLVVA